jgi:predicted unusual protein kinase regulating ubiquinone biosynthesis (AarF/ABC1/UbiB family)
MQMSPRLRSRPPRNPLVRFLIEGQALARLFAGYKLISLAERWLPLRLLSAFQRTDPGDLAASTAGRAAPGAAKAAWAEAQRHRHHRRSAWLLHDTAIRNQGLLIKTAQFLSSRPDILPDEYIDVLSRLQDEVPPVSFEAVRREVERELGQPLEAVFREFAPAPVASASLAQVHRAVLLDGRVAAVKVLYPGIEELVGIDLRNIDRFVAILGRLDRTLDFRFISEEMGVMIPKELDFLNEGRNAEAIAANFAGVQDVAVPRIYWEHTTRRVLTMEYVEGVKITDTAAIEAMGIDTADVAKILIVAFSEMLLEHGVFHADPHPGNLLVARGETPDAPRLVLVDFGQVKQIGPQFRFVFAQMTRALLADDETALGKTFRDLGFRMKRDQASGYEQLGKAYVGDISRQMLAAERGWVSPEMFQDSYRDVFRILRANPVIKIPADLLFVGRVMGLLNGLSMTLRSRTNLLVQMARLLDEQAAGKSPAAGVERRLLEA